MFFLHPAATLAQNKYYFKRYEVENGLSNNLVSCCAQDAKGFMWFGTFDGLNRFDGLNFKTFRRDINNKKSIGDNKIFSLYTAYGQLWVGTNSGLYKYNSDDESFQLIEETRGKLVSSLCSDNYGSLWFTTDKKICRYGEKKAILKCYKSNLFKYTSICKDSAGTIWAGTASGHLVKYEIAIDSFISFNLFPSASTPPLSRYLVEISPTENSSLLVGTINEGLKLFDIPTAQSNDVPIYRENNGKISANEFIHLAGDEYWIGTETGLYTYHLKSGNHTYLHTEHDNPYSLSDNAITALFKDKEGGIWVGTRFGGVCYYPYQYTAFTKYFPQQNTNSIKGNGIHEIVTDNVGNLWIGSEDAGLNKLNKKLGTFEHFFPDGKAGSIAYSNIHGLLTDGNDLWIGTYQHGLDRMNLKTKKVERHYSAGQSSFTDNFIIHLFKTSANEILVGTYDGLYRYDRSKDDFDLIPGFAIPTQSIMEDKDGLLWICTLGNGVFTLDKAGKILNLLADANNPNSLAHNSVNGQFIDSKGIVWFATEGGLSRYDPIKNLFKTYTTADGLPSNFLLKILEDDERNLWISTTKGLVKFNAQNASIEVFTSFKGLLNDQFNWNSAYKDDDGTMYFGSVKGLISFNPKEFSTNTNIPPVYITNIQINNKDFEPLRNASGYKQSIIYTHKIELAYNQSSITLDFAALSYVSPESNKYAYKLEGLDNDWKVLSSHRPLYYTGLPPGNYTFRVKACNSSGVWNNTDANLNIVISPPIWESSVAYIVYFLTGIFIIGFIVNIYHKTFLEKNKRKGEQLEHEKEKQLYQYKIELFTNVAHEIRTPLTLIQGPMEEIMSYENNNPIIAKYLKIMELNTGRLINIANQVLDFRQAEVKQFSLNLEHTNISEAVKLLHASFQPLAANNNVIYQLSLPAEDIYAHIDPESFQKILNNLYSNAIKYSKSKVLVTVTTNDQKSKFIIEILNDGHLIPVELKEKIFEPFFREREANKQNGSGIGLAIAKSFTELHKGTLELKDPKNEMNVFHLELPIN